jgi:2-polyprenyl-3-methyl-5-hydroxy-6-metoxy-1,4-benzoquinol methylase
MNRGKSIFLRIAGIFAVPWRGIPSPLRHRLFLVMFVLESRDKKPEASLRSLFYVEDYLNLVINERSLKMGNGEHPKHSLIPYHQFFIRNLQDSKRVLDVGCGYGAVARSIAESLPHVQVTGIENNLTRYMQAHDYPDNPKNLNFIFTDLYAFKPDQDFDHVILSNVLEHLEDRVETLRELRRITKAKTILIRVPAFERHWTIPMRKELGINYFSDDDHKIEHTLEEFYAEMAAAGLVVTHIQTLWGEIWAVCK